MAEKPKKKGGGLGWAVVAVAVGVGGHFVAKSLDETPKKKSVPLEERMVSTDCLEALSSPTSSAAKNGVSAFDERSGSSEASCKRSTRKTLRPTRCFASAR